MVAEIVVYLHGNEPRGEVLYRIVLKPVTYLSSVLSKLKCSVCGKGKKIVSPIAVLPQKIFGIRGSWAVIGDDIYWAGTWFYDQTGKITVSNELLKHNIHHPDPTHWETVTTLNIPRANPVLAVAGGRKLAIVAGEDYRTVDCFDDSVDSDSEDEGDDNHRDKVVVANWRNCGEIYDLDQQSLDYLTPDIQLFEPYQENTTEVEAEDQRPTQVVVFYSLDEGSILILDASTGNIEEHRDPSFALFGWHQGHPLPLGLEDEDF